MSKSELVIPEDFNLHRQYSRNLKSWRNYPVWLMISLQHIKTRSMEHSLWEQSIEFQVTHTLLLGHSFVTV